MNKFIKILLSILGGADVSFTIFFPILLSVLWITTTSLPIWQDYTFLVIGILATVFRAIKIGWLKEW